MVTFTVKVLICDDVLQPKPMAEASYRFKETWGAEDKEPGLTN